MIPFLDFGGQGPALHLAHANGYPPGAYRPLAQALTARFQVSAMLARPLWPGSRPEAVPDWLPLADDFLQFLDERRLGPLVGVGHSLGAVTTLIAALRRPEAFHALVLLDPVLLGYPAALVWRLLIRLGLAARLHPLVPTTLRRRRVFETQAAMFDHYRRKRIFSRLSDEALHIYTAAAARPRPDGQVELVYPPEWEARIYLTGPLNERRLWAELKQLRVPLLILRGAESDTFWPRAARMIERQLPRAEIVTLEGTGHLLPLERPQAVAEAILRFTDQLTGSNSQIQTSDLRPPASNL